MTPVRFEYRGLAPDLARRQLLGQFVETFHRECALPPPSEAAWTVSLGDRLLFDRAGLAAIQGAILGYAGDAELLRFDLVPGPEARRDYYSLAPFEGDALPLPVEARRPHGTGEARVRVPLPERTWPLEFPAALAPRTRVSVPRALLMPVTSPFDVLFANQIAIFPELERHVSRAPGAWLEALFGPRRGGGFTQRAGLAWRRVHRTADVHPTAVIEGSSIGPGVRIGAHCMVRYSWIGAGARLHDGAKVEYSVVGANSWLMHDLVLSRSVVEDECFLIHGPYQFSHFQHRSAAFATILMDYRPDGKPIQVATDRGLLPYGGAFLGSVFEEGARAMGGTLLAPGRIVPRDTWIGADPSAIHSLGRGALEPGRVLPPHETRRG